MKKLTLSVDKETIELAKQIAKRNGTSVSAMFGRLIRGIGEQNKEIDIIVPPGSLTARAKGIISLPEGKSVRDVLTEALMDKYGIDQ